MANAFEWKIAPAEAAAKRIFEAEGKPTNSSEERVSQRWYANEILWTIGAIRGTMPEAIGQDGHLRQGDAWPVLGLAAHLGELVGEAKEVGFSRETGLKTPKRKKCRPLVLWLRDTVKRNPDESSTFFWNSLPDQDEGDDPIRIDNAEFIRVNDLLVIFYDNGRSPSLTYRAFERYVSDIKKELKI